MRNYYKRICKYCNEEVRYYTEADAVSFNRNGATTEIKHIYEYDCFCNGELTAKQSGTYDITNVENDQEADSPFN